METSRPGQCRMRLSPWSGTPSADPKDGGLLPKEISGPGPEKSARGGFPPSPARKAPNLASPWAVPKPLILLQPPQPHRAGDTAQLVTGRCRNAATLPAHSHAAASSAAFRIPNTAIKPFWGGHAASARRRLRRPPHKPGPRGARDLPGAHQGPGGDARCRSWVLGAHSAQGASGG